MNEGPEHDLSGESESDEGFLSRWSRRKQQARDEEPQSMAEQAVPPVEQQPAEEVYQPGDEDMPPLESLDEESDYSGFMSPKVSDELRRLALRKLFHGSSFNILDGLNDYDDDYTTFEKLGDIVTSDMKFLARQAELKAAAQANAAQAEGLRGIEDQADDTAIEPADSGGQPADVNHAASQEHPERHYPEPEPEPEPEQDIDEEEISG